MLFRSEGGNLINQRTQRVNQNSFSKITPIQIPQPLLAVENTSDSLSNTVMVREPVPIFIATVESLDNLKSKVNVKQVDSAAVNDFLDTARATQKLISEHKPIDSSQSWEEVEPDVQSVPSPQKSYDDSRDSPVQHERDPIPMIPIEATSQISSRLHNGKLMRDDPELHSLLIKAKLLGIKVDDQRHKPGGALYVALYETPDEPTQILLKKLVDLGLKIWPGKTYLK